MRILIVTPDFPLWDGGVAVWAEKLAACLTRLQQQVTVITPRQLAGDGEFDSRQPYRVVRVANVKDRYLKFAYAHWRLRGFLRDEQFDRIIAVTWFPFANAVSRFAPSLPLCLLAHGNDFLERRWERPFWRRRMGRAFALARVIIAVSHETEKALRRTLPALGANLGVVCPAVDPAEFMVSGLPTNEPPILLGLGRVVERKGQDMVIRAMPAILKEFPQTEYWIAGRGPYLDTLKTLAAELGLQKQVRCLGFVSSSERLKLYQRCAVYLMPSRAIDERRDFEGFGITFLEANACGKPVIGGRSGGVADAVLDGVTGFLVDPNSPADIAEKTLRLLRGPALARKLGQQGRERVERELNWENTTRKVLELIA